MHKAKKRTRLKWRIVTYRNICLNFINMFCKSCGSQIDIDSKFCSFCGAKQSSTHKPDVNEINISEEAIHLPLEVSIPTIQHEREKEIPRYSEKNIIAEDLIKENRIESPRLVSSDLLDDILPIVLLEHRPESVNYAVFLLIPGIVNSIAGMFLGMERNTMTGVSLFFSLLFTTIKAIVVYDIYNGSKRGRNIFFVLATIEFLGLFSLIPSLKYSGITEQMLIGIIMIFELIAVILLLSKTSKLWFNSRIKKNAITGEKAED
jgi:zinc-ribbon domain